MAQTALGGNPVNTAGDLPSVGSTTPSFTVTKADLSDNTPADLAGQRVVLNIFPSIDTPVDESGTVLHSQLVPEIAQEPDYDAAVASLG